MKKIVDLSAGTKTFGYDQWGNPNKETDANGKITNVVYDQYGRILSRTTPEMSTTYTYNTDGLLQTETSNNGTGKNITYDALGRTVTFKETGTDGKWLQKGYTYAQGQISTVSYTSQSGAITTETNTYQGGYLKKITLTGGQVIYDLQQENALGMATKVVSGPVTRNYSYDQYGMPTGRSAQTQAGTYMNFTYNFNAATGNLNWRKDVTRNLTENFTYDNLNRLTGFGGQTASYDAKGNILQKSGIGAFHYLNSSKPYALSGIVQSGSVIPQRQQQITYASFSRPLSIAEDGYSAHFTYEAGGDRVRMHVTKSGALVLKRHYLANQYELDEKPGSTQEKLYLGGDYYNAGAVLVRENGGAWQVYYVNSDYLGSITHVVNSAGSVVAEYSYDAWGRLRNPVNQMVFGSAQQPDLFLGRGYTGHEHLNWFSLINMNARLYDPVHGRFLAPDPYLQAPDFTQSFNRYTYGLNNPLSFVDQDGEFFHFILGALIGVATNGISNLINNQPFFKGALKAGLIGGVGGYASNLIGNAANTLSGLGKFAFQTASHGTLGGLMSKASGGTFGQGFLSGALGSIGGTASMKLMNNVSSKALKAIGTVGSGGLMGGIGSSISGGDFWDGVRNGTISSGLNHAVHAGVLGEGMAVAALTGRTRHVFGPDAIAGSITLDAMSGVGPNAEKGGLVVLRGEEKGVYGYNDIGAGIGLVSISAGVEIVKFYSSASRVEASQFYGARYEGNIGFDLGIGLGFTATYGRFDGGFTIGYGMSAGVGVSVTAFSFNLNKGLTVQKVRDFPPTLKNGFFKW